MEQKLIKRILVVVLVFVFISVGNAFRLKGIEDIKGVHMLSLLTCGFGLGALAVTLVMLFARKKSKANEANS
jgi:hypothetical protein